MRFSVILPIYKVEKYLAIMREGGLEALSDEEQAELEALKSLFCKR